MTEMTEMGSRSEVIWSKSNRLCSAYQFQESFTLSVKRQVPKDFIPKVLQ